METLSGTIPSATIVASADSALGFSSPSIGDASGRVVNVEQTEPNTEHRSRSDPLSDNEFSRDGEDDSPDALSRIPVGDMDPETLEQLRRQEREEREEIEKELRAQSESLNLCTQGGALRDTRNNNSSRICAPPTPKEPLSLGLAGLEAFRREYLTSPLSHVVPIQPSAFPPLLSQHVSAATMASIAESSFAKHHQLHSSRPGPPSSAGSTTPPFSVSNMQGSPSQQSPSSEFTSQQNWSFEEQFKQLYELSDDAKRKDFLDELFAFMQKRGTPINRLPIMAKQVLDLFELYNLVTARGGLVEVINKKQWQEIIKGLNLPSSITSAAFTLRTQYTKYIYPYECHMKNLSNPNELQAAIDGNRREGRRSGYDSYPHMFAGPRPALVPLSSSTLSLQQQMSPLPTPQGLRPSAFNGNAAVAAAAAAAAGFPGLGNSPGVGGRRSPPGLTPANHPLSALEMTRLALFKMYNQAGLPPPGSLPGSPGLQDMGRVMAEQQVRAMQVVREAEAEREREAAEGRQKERERDIQKDFHRRQRLEEDDDGSPPSVKRERRDSVEGKSNGTPMGGANIRITSRGDSGESSLVVSLEINSVMYQGVLFAQPNQSNKTKEKRDNRISSSNAK